MVPQEVPPAAEAALAVHLLEEGADPTAWALRYLWARDVASPDAFAVVLACG